MRFNSKAVKIPTLVYWALSLALGFAFSGCTKEKPVDQKNVFYMGNDAQPSTLSPHLAYGLAEQRVILGLFEGLVRLDGETLNPMPSLAESWTINETGCIYRFNLRPQLKWSDGSAITAQGIVDSFELLLSPASRSLHPENIYFIHNAKAFHKGQVLDFKAVGIKAMDEHTIEFTLDYPVPYFLAQLAYMGCFPVPVKAIAAHKDAWVHPENMLCSGPFKLKAWKANDSIHLVANPYYWDAANVRLKEVVVRLIGDDKTEETAFLQGQLHVVTRVPISSIQGYMDRKDERFYNTPYWGTEFYWFNCNHPQLKDVRVRKALSLVIDRQGIIDNILKRGQLPTHQYVPLSGKGYRCEDPKEDIELAKQLLAEAGYPGGEGLSELSFFYNTSNDRRLVAQAIQELWSKHLGVKMKIEDQEWKTFLQTRHKKAFDIARGGWIGDFPDPVSFLDLFRSNSMVNFSHWANPAYDALLDEAARTIDSARRNELLRQAETIVINEYPGIPLFFMNWSALVQPNVHGWHKNVLDYHPLKDIWLE